MQEIVDVDDKLIEKIEVHRLGEDAGGFQRKLNEDRIHRMADQLTRATGVPPIMVANVGGKLTLVDGQHRLEAWKLNHYPLKALIFKADTMHKAAQSFVEINANQRRVTREHILTISDDPWSREVRRLAKSMGCKLGQAHSLLQGVTKTEGNLGKQPKEEHIELAKKVLSYWQRDRRWDQVQNGIFAHAGTLKLVGRLARDANSDKDLEHIIRELLSKVTWNAESHMYAIYGTSPNRQKAMRNQIKKICGL